MITDSTSRPPTSSRSKATFALVSLGCPKNLIDSERMLGLLVQDGYRLVDDPAGADFVVVNTCGFIKPARDESYAAIREMVDLKRRGKTRGVIVSGCLAERQKDALLAECPEIDQVVGVFGREEIARAARRLMDSSPREHEVFRPAPRCAMSDGRRFRITPRHFAYLKISEGCDRLCTFCSIPKMRGRHVSKPIEQIVAEARELADDGARELIVVAQDATYYGVDLYGGPRLAEMVRRLDRVRGLDWIRLMYLYPRYVTDELIDAIAGAEHVVPYLDMPLQHISDAVLRRMGRPITRHQTLDLIGRLRSRIPGLALRTTLIAGFPGETPEQFEELVRFVAQQRFERLGVFTYSLEPDTPAAKLPGHLPEEEKTRRRDRLMSVQQPVAAAWNDAQVGKRLHVLLDAPVPEEENVWIGRTFADAPEIDGAVYVTGDRLEVGKLVPCEIVAARHYDLIAAPIGPPR